MRTNVHVCRIHELAQAIEAIGVRHQSGEVVSARMTTGWVPVDELLGGGLACGRVHEWYGGSEERGARSGERKNAGAGDGEAAPLGVLAHLARRAMSHDPAASQRWAVWIGRGCWPYPRVLTGEEPPAAAGSSSVAPRSALLASRSPPRPPLPLRRSLFVDVDDPADRLWAMELAARNRSIAAVVGDGCGLSIKATRRLQLAAEAGGAVVLLARPGRELATLSAATTRWRVLPVVSPNDRPRWRLELLRCKGVQASGGMEASRGWLLEWNGAKNLVALSADVVDRPGAAALDARVRFGA